MDDSIDYPAVVESLQSENERLRLRILSMGQNSYKRVDVKAYLRENAMYILLLSAIALTITAFIDTIHQLMKGSHNEG
jgi:hypothetical protein